MPPVFGPRSPSSRRLWSREGGNNWIAVPETTPAPLSAVAAGLPDMSAIVASNAPAVVNISVAGKVRHRWGGGADTQFPLRGQALDKKISIGPGGVFQMKFVLGCARKGNVNLYRPYAASFMIF